jgi:hypothetical protein
VPLDKRKRAEPGCLGIAESASQPRKNQAADNDKKWKTQRVARRGCVSPSAMPPFFGWPRKPPADPYGKVAELAKLTCETPPFGTVGPDAELVRALKQEVRRDENAMGRVHDVLCKALAHKECGPRSHAVSVFDILFHRSVVFRSLALVSLDVFLHLGVGTDGDNHPLPGPPTETRQLIDKAVAALESWNDKFGVHHPRLALAVRFANDSLGADAPAARAAATLIANRKSQRRENARLVERWRRVELELPRLTTLAEEAIDSMRSCLGVVLGGGDAWGDAWGDETHENENNDEDEWEDVDADGTADSGNAYDKTFANASYPKTVLPEVLPELLPEVPISVTETLQNRQALATLRQACLLAKTRFVPALAAASSLLARIAPDTELGAPGVAGEVRAAGLNTIADLKRELCLYIRRCASVGILEAGLMGDTAVGAGIDDIGTGDTDGTQANAGAAQTHSGALVVTVPRLVAAPPRDEEETPQEGDTVALDALLERARRRRGRQNAVSERPKPRDPGTPFWMGRPSTSQSAAAKTSGLDASLGSVDSRARKIFASREASKHNLSVMRELGESGVTHRDGVSGFGNVMGRRRELEANEDAARALAETEAREAKRKRDEPTPKQRIEARLKQMRAKGKR